MEPLVFWHGWGLGPGVWHDLVETLRPKLGPDYELIIQPMPGYDASQQPVVHYSVGELLEALLQDLPSPVTLCGWSLGAMLAMLAAARFPSRVERLVLIGASPNFMKRADWPGGIAMNMIDKLGSGVRIDPQNTLRRFVSICNQNDIHARDVARKLSDVTSAPTATLEAGLDLLKHTDLRPIVQDIRQPTLLVHGAHDTLMPLSAAEWLQNKMKYARLAVLPDASHAPFLSDTPQTAELISSFLHATA